MNKVKIFENPEFGQVRTMTDENNEPWFVGKDVAEILGYARTADAIRVHVDSEDKGVCKTPTPSGPQDMTIINESGLYSLILSSKLPKAKQFKHWITSEVLPSIRKTGGYIAGQETMSSEELMAKALMVAQQTLAQRDVQISHLTVENQIMSPKAEYFDELVERNTLMSFRETAKELGIGPKKFIQFLLDKKYIFRDQKGKLMPYEDKNKGLFEVKECFNEKTQWAGSQTLVTPKGRETFRLLILTE